MKKIFVIIAIVLAQAASWAQGSIKVQAQNIVAAGEQFSVSFVIESGKDGKPSDFDWDCGSDFQLVWGPQTGTSTSTFINNGKVTTSSQYTYSYIVTARKAGKFILPSATAKIGGNLISSSPKTIEVVAGDDSSAATSKNENSNNPTFSDIGPSELFIRLSLSRTSAVVGEPITATLKLFQKADISGFEDIRFPSFKGFWSQTLEAPSNINFQREVVADRIYNSAVLRSWVIVPQQTGELPIEKAELTCLVNIRVQSRSNSIFDSFFDDNVRTIRKRLTTGEKIINVSPLPAGAPASFGGGVGQFTMSATVSKDSLKAHEAASLTVTLSGSGNVALLEAPKINFPPDFEVYDAKQTDNSTRGGTSGSKTFEFPFIPRSHGSFDIPPIEWTYYDSKTRKYVTLTSQEIHLEVAPGSGSGAASSSGLGGALRLPDRSGVRTLSEDIRYIRTSMPSLSKGSSMIVSGAVYPVLLILMALGTAAFWLFRRRSARRRADVAGMRGRRAAKMAMGRLSKSKAYLDKQLDTAFYEELHKALLGFISDKFNMPQEELDKESISGRLTGSGVPEETAKEFLDLVDACEYARYSPDSGEGALKAHYDNAVKVISTIESTMKTRRNTPKAVMILLALTASLQLSAADADSLWRAGTEAYAQSDWQVAVDSWSALEAEGWQSPVLSYNLGNAWFNSGNLAKAILYYERALKADPSFSDARNNLEFANSLTQDNIDSVPEFLLKSLARDICYIFPANLWAIMSLLLFAGFCLLMLLFLLGSTSSARRKGFYGGLAALIFAGATAGFALWQADICKDNSKAIITMPVVSVKNSPTGTSAKDLFVLHEGTKVTIIDKVGEYSNITIADGRQGWIKTASAEVI